MNPPLQSRGSSWASNQKFPDTTKENTPQIMPKATVQYTTKDLRELGLFVEVPGRTDTDTTRKKALEEIQRRMEDPEDTTLNPKSFADGLSADDLIFVEQPNGLDSEGEEPEIIQAVRAIATLASLRVSFEEAYKSAVELRPLIEALFSPDPLTPEQMQQATDKTFAKVLIKFAEAKAARDSFLPIAVSAWEVLAPALPAVVTNNNPLMIESQAQAAVPVSEAQQDTSENGQEVSEPKKSSTSKKT